MSKLNRQDNPKSKDCTGHAPESGEPTEIGFSHGRPIEQGDSKTGSGSKDRSPTPSHVEPGRQDATPRSSR